MFAPVRTDPDEDDGGADGEDESDEEDKDDDSCAPERRAPAIIFGQSSAGPTLSEGSNSRASGPIWADPPPFLTRDLDI